MITRFLQFLFLLSLGTTSSFAQSPRRDRQYNRWMALVEGVPASPAAAATALERIRRRTGLWMDLWADSTIDSTRYILDDAPCGSVATLFLQRLPSPSLSHHLTSELAVEIDSLGRELQRWPVPLDSWVDGVNGTTLLVPYDFDNRAHTKITVDLAIESSGSFTVVAQPATHAQPAGVPCPPIQVFAGSAYAECEWFTDRASGRKRLITFQRPCT